MIIITGSGRSGTSAVARLVHVSGLSVGHDLVEADESNAEGYFEERSIIVINDHILEDAGMRDWFTAAPRAELLEAARAQESDMRMMIRAATPVWKDPRFCWTLEAWMELMYLKPRVIVCLRSPSEVVASTLKYYGQVSDEAKRHVEHRWLSEYERLLEIIDEFSLDAISVEFEALHGDPAKAVKPLERFLGRKLDSSGIRTDLRHHAEATPAEMRETYARVRALGGADVPGT
jgi:hypothetical protein